ncbi:YjgN family protein [Photobacterium sp. CCB-ST2H9]|uniref:DUF898 family protein n=1 Tax=Photobacterium sp. CCB-ST2H9 TaxID=2912855 RepID=UPI002005C27D|nr:DUF898 family protein [Photobacterium sp. CCB-ST2H9]UTM56881.1 YjgN family protein [Photobacterium sp. CCB-ST2H9]
MNHKITCDIELRKFLKILFKDILLTFISSGAYWVWAMPKIMQYTYSQTKIGSFKFDYHVTPYDLLQYVLGLGGVLFVWFVVAVQSIELFIISAVTFILCIPLFYYKCVQISVGGKSLNSQRFNFSGPKSGAYFLFFHPKIVFFLFLVCGFVYSGFQIQRTNEIFSYGLYGCAFLSMILLIVVFVVEKARYIINHYEYGNYCLKTTISEKDIFQSVLSAFISVKYFFVAIALSGFIYWMSGDDFWKMLSFVFAFVLILSFCISYAADYRRRYFDKIRVDGIDDFKFVSTASGWHIFLHCFSCLYSFIFTFGLAMPWLFASRHKFYFEHIMIVGELRQIERERVSAAQIETVG